MSENCCWTPAARRMMPYTQTEETPRMNQDPDVDVRWYGVTSAPNNLNPVPNGITENTTSAGAVTSTGPSM